MITVELEHSQLQETLRRVEWAVGDLAPLMRGIRTELVAISEENLESQGQGDDKWESLSEVTTSRREAAGTWPGQMLQVSAGGLAASITGQATEYTALVGSNKVYAAMMHFGGKKDEFPHLWGDIPGRPYFPMDTEGKLQPEAEESILDMALEHIRKAARL